MSHQNYQNLMLLTSSDTKRTLMHLLLFTNSAQTELVSICTQSIHNLSLHYILGMEYVFKVNIAFVKTIIATNEVRPIKVKNRKTTFKSFYVYLILLKKQIVLPEVIRVFNPIFQWYVIMSIQ